MSDERDYRIKQSGTVVAGAAGPAWHATEEILRYGRQYVKDGPVVVEEKIDGVWKKVLTLDAVHE